MAAEIKVPSLGESVTTATIARWLKQPGDQIAADEALVELETDKVTVEVNAPAAGTLEAILAPAGADDDEVETVRHGQSPSTRRRGSSMISLTRTRKLTASRPSTMRWS